MQADLVSHIVRLIFLAVKDNQFVLLNFYN